MRPGEAGVDLAEFGDVLTEVEQVKEFWRKEVARRMLELYATEELSWYWRSEIRCVRGR